MVVGVVANDSGGPRKGSGRLAVLAIDCSMVRGGFSHVALLHGACSGMAECRLGRWGIGNW